MPVTSLEAISEKLKEQKELQLEQILMVSGSNAIKKNEYGITVVDNKDAASSLVFKPLLRPKLDEKEIIKAVDVQLKELKPQIPNAENTRVAKELYDAQVKENKALLVQIDGLKNNINDLEGTIASLKSDVEIEKNERLNLQQSNDALSNQTSVLNQSLSDFATQMQNAVQKSVDESILRASLQAQNVGYKAQIETLIKQIDSLNSMVDSTQTQLYAAQKAAQDAVAEAARIAGDPLEGTDVIETGGIVWRITKGKKRHYISYNNAGYRGDVSKLTQVTGEQMGKYDTGPEVTLQEEIDVPFLYATK